MWRSWRTQRQSGTSSSSVYCCFQNRSVELSFEIASQFENILPRSSSSLGWGIPVQTPVFRSVFLSSTRTARSPWKHESLVYYYIRGMRQAHAPCSSFSLQPWLQLFGDTSIIAQMLFSNRAKNTNVLGQEYFSCTRVPLSILFESLRNDSIEKVGTNLNHPQGDSAPDPLLTPSLSHYSAFKSQTLRNSQKPKGACLRYAGCTYSTYYRSHIRTLRAWIEREMTFGMCLVQDLDML